MESPGASLPRRESSSSRTSRRSSTVRIKPHTHRSNSSLRPYGGPKTPKPSEADDHSLISFPSLSPSVENSPNNIDNILERPTPKADVNKTLPARGLPHALAGLFAPSNGQDGEPALFDDTPSLRDVPGSIHLQSDENVQHLVTKTGAVALVKQLAQDLAERDAEITLLQRRAEERESLLRKMLRECEVSNMDIENRLNELRKSRAKTDGSGFGGELRRADGKDVPPEASIQDRLQEAFGDELHIPGSSINGPQGDHSQDAAGTTRRRPAPRVSSQAVSTISTSSTVTSKSGTTRGWKGFFGYGGTENSKSDRPSSMSAAQEARMARGSQTVRGTSTRSTLGPALDSATGVTNEARSRADSGTGSNGSVATWALRMVAGQNQAGSGQAQSRSRASTAAAHSNKNDSSLWGMPGIQRTKSRPNEIVTNSRKGSLGSASAGNAPSATFRRAGTGATNGSLSGMMAPPSPGASIDTSAGPVEMDSIVPDEKLPPTLMQYNNYGSSSEYLTDRFGFIYDQRRRRRQNEAAAALNKPALPQTETYVNHRRSMASLSSVPDTASIRSQLSTISSAQRPETPRTEDGEDTAPKRWQDYLNLSIFGSELLSHTPAAAAITEVAVDPVEAELAPEVEPIITKKRSSLPLSSTTAAVSTATVTSNADLAPPTTLSRPPSSRSQNDPVKALLEQVNDVHDSLQKSKVIKWNDFLRKVRAERKRDGEQGFNFGGRTKHTSNPEATLLDGEIIGVAGLGVKGKVGRAKAVEFRNLVLGGIPVTYRAKVWAECCGASTMRVPGYYEELVNSTFTDDVIAQQISMDITRTLTDNIFFRKGLGIAKLNEVLLAYARRNPEVGYCQGMNLITANLLLIVPTAEDAFWILTSIIENILPAKYYDSSLLTSRADQVVLRQYVTEVLPPLSAHLEALSIDLEAVTFQWFLSVFTDALSAEALFRLWDVVFCLNDGATFLFQIALALLKLNEAELLGCESPSEVYAYVNQKMTDHAISIDGLIRAADGLKREVKREDVVERRKAAVDTELETIKQREAVRNGKKPASSASKDRAAKPELSPGLLAVPNLSKTSLHDSGVDTMKSRSGRLTRQSSRVSFGLSTRDEEEMEEGGARWEYGELEGLTPMPIDEEFQWRA